MPYRLVHGSKLAGICGLTLVAVMLGPAGTARAEEPAESDRAAETPTRYDFEDDEVLGSGVRPGSEILYGRRRTARTSLVRVRDSFVRELVESIEAL